MAPLGTYTEPTSRVPVRAPRPLPAPDGAAPPPDGSDLCEVATSFQQVRVHAPDDLESWQNNYPADAPAVRLFLDLHRSDPRAAHRLAQAVTAMPEAGADFLGFRLIEELGRGALGRVFLARQGDLANRHVVLKVSPDVAGETQTLAQLQHTNVVPLYSAHRAGPMQAVCMPYFGRTTLAHVLQGLGRRDSLPESGQGLVSTLMDRKPTQGPAPTPAEMPIAEPSGDSDAAPLPRTPNATLEMLQGLSYVEAVLWLGARLADGLAHAHERGILHRDIKPANILLADDGQPMLLDFNLAQDTKLAGSAAAAQVGGTLPFMAPEQLQAYQARSLTLNYNSDVYSLGVILFELLTGRHPFPNHAGPVKQVLDLMIGDRLKPAPRVRRWNRAATPAVESIVRHCLEADPARRYRTARDLQEDLDRQLHHLPLKHAPEPSLRERATKWLRRHPRVTSTSMAAAVGAVLVAVGAGLLVVREQRLTAERAEQDRLLALQESRDTLGRFDDHQKKAHYLLTARIGDSVQVDRGVEACRAALAEFRVLDDPSWQESPSAARLPDEERARLRQETGETLLLMARGLWLQARDPNAADRYEERLQSALNLNRLAEACYGPAAPQALWAQRADLAAELKDEAEAQTSRAKAEATPARTAADHCLAAFELQAKGKYREAVPVLRDAIALDPKGFRAWFLLGVCHDNLVQNADAVACYSTCLAIADTHAYAYLNRGLARLRLQDFRQAEKDLDRAIELRPDLADAYLNRANARSGLRNFAGAADDLTRALERGAPTIYTHMLRSVARERAGDAAGARADREEGLRRDPDDELGWSSRGYARVATDPQGALADFDRALKINPRSLSALQNKAYALTQLKRDADAVVVLNRAVELYPDAVRPRAGRAVILARLGQRDAAHKDAEEVRQRDATPLITYQLAGVYAMSSRTHPTDGRQALRLLGLALRQGFGLDLVEKDKDLDPIRDRPEFGELVAAARVIRDGGTDAKPQQ